MHPFTTGRVKASGVCSPSTSRTQCSPPIEARALSFAGSPRHAVGANAPRAGLDVTETDPRAGRRHCGCSTPSACQDASERGRRDSRIAAWTPSQNAIRDIGLFFQTDLVDEASRGGVRGRRPRIPRWRQCGLEALQQAHEVPHGMDVMGNEDPEVAQRPHQAVDGVLVELRTQRRPPSAQVQVPPPLEPRPASAAAAVTAADSSSIGESPSTVGAIHGGYPRD